MHNRCQALLPRLKNHGVADQHQAQRHGCAGHPERLSEVAGGTEEDGRSNQTRGSVLYLWGGRAINDVTERARHITSTQVPAHRTLMADDVCMIRIWITHVKRQACFFRPLFWHRPSNCCLNNNYLWCHAPGVPRALQMHLQHMKPLHRPLLPRHLQRNPNKAMEAILHLTPMTVPPNAGRALMWTMPWQSCQTMRPTRAAHRNLPSR